MKVYVHKDGKQYGPFTVEQLRKYVGQGNFTKDDHACHDGQNWVKIAQVPGFAEATQPAATQPPTIPRQDQVVQEKAVEQKTGHQQRGNPPNGGMKLVRYLRSLDTIPKWMMVVFATGLAWFFADDSFSSRDEEWVFFWTGIVALASYWALFGFKKDSE